jgi:hypothetical protein
MADNPYELKNFGLLAALGAEPRRNSLLDYVTAPPPDPSPMARTLADLLMDKSKPALPVSPFSGAASELFAPLKPSPPLYSYGNLGAVADLLPPAKPALPVSSYPYSGALGDLFGLPEATTSNPMGGAVADLFQTAPRSNPFLSPPSPPTRLFGSLADLVAPPALPLYNPPAKPKPVAPETKRKAFFSFNFDDIMRVNNVRNAWKIDHPNSASNRSFYDSSLWEARKLVDPDAIKRLIRFGVLGTSAVCILAGSMTWGRRWVRYEIARAIIDGRGLLTVHLNGINHHQTKGPHPRGRNPLAHIGIAKLQRDDRLPPQYYLYQMTLVPDGQGDLLERWSPYSDHAAPVKKPHWLTEPGVNEVAPLSMDASEYDYERDHGDRNIGSWIDQAAKQAGR